MVNYSTKTLRKERDKMWTPKRAEPQLTVFLKFYKFIIPNNLADKGDASFVLSLIIRNQVQNNMLEMNVMNKVYIYKPCYATEIHGGTS